MVTGRAPSCAVRQDRLTPQLHLAKNYEDKKFPRCGLHPGGDHDRRGHHRPPRHHCHSQRFVRARLKAQQSACINNLRQIDGAKQTWALENKAGATPSPPRPVQHSALSLAAALPAPLTTCPAGPHQHLCHQLQSERPPNRPACPMILPGRGQRDTYRSSFGLTASPAYAPLKNSSEAGTIPGAFLSGRAAPLWK